MSFLLALVAAASLAAACPLSSPSDLSNHFHASPMDVNLTHLYDNKIRLAVTNLDDRAYNILHEGSLFDPAPLNKLLVKGRSSLAPFYGMEKRLDLHNGDLSQRAFTILAAGQTINQDLDVASLYELLDEMYSVSTDGFLHFADDEDMTHGHAKSLPYSSNKLVFRADAAIAKRTAKAIDSIPVKRTTLEDDCSADQKGTISAANQKCASMASAAADAASNGDPDFFGQYFHDSSSSTRDKVSSIFSDVAKECSSTPGGSSEGHCTDPYGNCHGDLLAYTIWQDRTSSDGQTSRSGKMYYCERYFDMLSPDPEECHQQSQATNTLHETTHAVAGTDDCAYGWDGIQGLSSDQAVHNADTFALYANDISLKCGSGGNAGGDSSGGPPPGYSSGGTNSGAGAASPPSYGGGSNPPHYDSNSWKDFLNSWKSMFKGSSG